MNFREIYSARAIATSSLKNAIQASQLTDEQKKAAIAEVDAANSGYLAKMEEENDAMFASFREGRKRIVESIQSGASARQQNAVRNKYLADCDRRRAQNERTLMLLWSENRSALDAIAAKYNL